MIKIKYLNDYQLEINEMVIDLQKIINNDILANHHKIEYQIKRIKDCIDYINELNRG